MSNRTRQDTRQDATAAVAVNANARAQLEAIRDEWLQPLVETISQQAERIGRLEAERDAQAATIVELRRRAALAEAALLRHREEEARAVELVRRRNEQEWLNRERMQAAQDAPGTPEALTPDTPSGAASAGFWTRVRRVFGGGGDGA